MLDNETIENLKNKKIYSLEGNIGAGKSTLLKLIAENFNDIELVEEPVGQWQNLGGSDLLQRFYEDPERWAYSFEFYSMLSKLKNLLVKASKSDKEIIIIERSLISNKIFIDISYELGKLQPMEYRILVNLYEFYAQNVYPKLAGIIYIDTPVDECIKRICKRNRDGESTIDKDYLEKLKAKFDRFEEDFKIKTHSIDGFFDLQRDVVKVTSDIHKLLCQSNSPSTTIEVSD